MLIGLMSDTHDNLPLVDKAVMKLNEVNVELTLHAGDFVAPFVVQRLKGLKSKLIGVFGNNDGDHVLLKKRFSEHENLELHDAFAEIDVEGLKIALLHGSEGELLDALVNSGYFDFVVHGHSHNAESRRKGKTFVVNPGEVCGYLSGRSTIAILDTETREVKIVEL
jgi:putative phosphoesterase